jgi:hypothetical protein
VQEELRLLEMKIQKNNVTRWNSTLFMIRSVNKISQHDYKTLISQLDSKKIDLKDFI